MGERIEKRTKASLPVTISGMDSRGCMFVLHVQTVDITPQGARLENVTCALRRGATILVQHKNCRARFRVVWVGDAGSPHHGQIGIRCMEDGRYIWGLALPRDMGDEYPPSAPAEVPKRLATAQLPSEASRG